MPFIDTKDARVHYDVTGEGPPLLLLAGIASDMASWTPVMPLLQPHFSLVTVDNRGAGRTEHSGAIDPADWIGDAIALLDHLGIAEADVVGHSMGGMIGLRLAARAPQRVRRLVVAATSGRPEAKSGALIGEMAALYEGGMEPETWFRLLFQWLFAPAFFEDPERVAEATRLSAAYEYRQSPADFRRQLDAVSRLDPLDIAAIRAETLLLLADLDVMVTPATSRASFAGMAKLTETVIADAGHSLHWDQPEAFATAVIGFLKG
ncbi:MAG: alpha/beta fold hydrolase [Rhizobiaceae bacterium]